MVISLISDNPLMKEFLISANLPVVSRPWDPACVRLVSRDGGYVELRPVSYQAEMPEPATEQDDDDYDEWLIVQGSVRLGDGREWTFVRPCLTTSEAQDLGVWLASAGTGRIAPSPASPPERKLLCFTEPNVAFSIAALSAERVSVRVHFSHES